MFDILFPHFGDGAIQAIDGTDSDAETLNNQQKIHTKTNPTTNWPK